MQRPSTQSNSNGNTNKNELDSSSEIGYVKNHRRADSTYKGRTIFYIHFNKRKVISARQCVKPTFLPLASLPVIPVLIKMYLKQCNYRINTSE